MLVVAPSRFKLLLSLAKSKAVRRLNENGVDAFSVPPGMQEQS